MRLTNILCGLLAAVLLLPACISGDSGGLSSLQSQPALQMAELSGLLPALPADQYSEDAEREASVLFMHEIQGSEIQSGNGAVVQPDDYGLLQTGDDGFRFAVYRLAGIAPEARLGFIQLELLDYTADTPLYCAFSDYSDNRWDFFGPLTSGDFEPTFELVDYYDINRHLSEGFNSYLAVILPPGEPDLEIDRLRIVADSLMDQPRNFQASDGLAPDRIELSWDDVPGAVGYEIQYKQPAEDETAWQRVKFVTGAGANHLYNDDPVCLINTEYSYRVQAIDENSIGGPFSEVDNGIRRTPAPASLYASQRLYDEGVLLLWPWVWGGGLFDIYRDGQPLVIGYDAGPQVNGLHSYMDTTVSDFSPHQYFVLTDVVGITSPPSPTAEGCKGQSAAATLQQHEGLKYNWRADMMLAPNGPSSAFLVNCFYEEADDSVQVRTTDPLDTAFQGATSPGRAVVNTRMSLQLHNGRTWLAWSNTDPGTDTVGVHLAAGGMPVPDLFNGWTAALLAEDEVGGYELKLREIGGRLALAYLSPDYVDFTGELVLCLADGPLNEPGSGFSSSVVREFNLSEMNLPNVFDLIEIDGMPAIALLYADGGQTYIECLRPLVEDPQGPDDWNTMVLSSSSFHGEGQGIAMRLHGNAVHVAAATGISESNGLLLVFSSTTPLPYKSSHWQTDQLLAYTNRDVSGLDLLFRDGQPVIAIADDNVIAPRLLSPMNDGGSGLVQRKWFESPASGIDFPYLPASGAPVMLDHLGNLFVLGVAGVEDAPDYNELLLHRLMPKEQL